MNLSKKRVFILSIFLFLFSMFSLAYAVCPAQPTSILVSSGSDSLGQVSIGQSVYINSNLQDDPLEVIFTFTHNNETCFDESAQVEFKLYNGANFIEPTSISTSAQESSFQTQATFLYNSNIDIETITSTLQVTTRDSNYVGSLTFSTESNEPILDVSTFPNQNVIGPGTEITISYNAQDSQAGLSEIIISPSSYSESFDIFTSSYSSEYSEILSSSKTFTITATDNLGYSSSQDVSFVVDSQGPEFSEFTLTNYRFNGDSRSVSFSVLVSDESFSQSSQTPEVQGDFSSFTTRSSPLQAQCSRESNNYRCSWNNLGVTLDESQDVQIFLNASDSLGNERSQSFTQNLFIDRQPPVIEDFYVENSLGVRNVLSPLDSNSTIKLVFRDESLTLQGIPKPQIFEDFDKIQFPVKEEGECESGSENRACYFWELGDGAQVYAGGSTSSAIFNVEVTDYFGSSTQESINITIDEFLPEIQNIEVEETTNSGDGLISSGEEILIRMFIRDTNLAKNGDYFIYGDFSTVDFRSGQDDVRASCTRRENNTHECVFRDIIVENGYYKRNVSFDIYDAAANYIQAQQEIEVFKVSDEEVAAVYNIPDIDILNPLNRNVILDSGVIGWFEGEIVEKSAGFTIMNYALQNCDEGDLNPLRIVERKLYPDDVVENFGQEDINDFTLKVGLAHHQNSPDLNQKTMGCTMSILYRDNTTIYQPGQLANFTLNFEFYDIPRGDLLEANAQKVLEIVDDADFLGSWFDTTYDIYEIFSGACNAIYNARAIFQTFSTVTTIVQGVLRGTLSNFDGGTTAGTLGQSSFPFSGFLGTLTEEGGAVSTMCSFVTCQYGQAGILGGVSDSFLGPLMDMQNSMGEAMCTFDVGGNDE